MDLSERRSGNPARHPWELARRDFFFALLRRFDLADAREILDVGSGDAWFARSLAQELGEAVHVTAWDAYYSADDLAQAADSVTLTSVQPAARCDGVMMLDVIEHVPDDLDFVSSIVERNVADEGWVLVSVPAYQLLYTSHDRQLRHDRRYSPRRCRNLLRASGLDLVAEGGVFHSLLLVRFAQAVAERLRPVRATGAGIGGWEHGALVTDVVSAALRAEVGLSLLLSRQRIGVVPGLSYWALCRKAAPGG